MEVEGAVPGRKYEDVGLLIDIALWLGREKMIESAASLELVRDFFLSHTIEECQQFFALLEDRADQLARAIVGDARANNTLLRALSEVRKRLSRTNDLVFAGRILMFMAYAFPLSDKSGTSVQRLRLGEGRARLAQCDASSPQESI
jgi:THO complex subunit 1